MEQLNFRVPKANIFIGSKQLQWIPSRRGNLFTTSVSNINRTNIWNVFHLVKTSLNLTSTLSKHCKSSFRPIPDLFWLKYLWKPLSFFAFLAKTSSSLGFPDPMPTQPGNILVLFPGYLSLLPMPLQFLLALQFDQQSGIPVLPEGNRSWITIAVKWIQFLTCFQVNVGKIWKYRQLSIIYLDFLSKMKILS